MDLLPDPLGLISHVVSNPIEALTNPIGTLMSTPTQGSPAHESEDIS